MDGLAANLGHAAAQEIIQSLALHIDRHLGEIGISNRFGRSQIVSILFGTPRAAAENVLATLARDLQERGLAGAPRTADGQRTYPLSILAGVAEGKIGEEIDAISERAKAAQKQIAGFECGLVEG
jgi:GGDEF domain-containing protein